MDWDALYSEHVGRVFNFFRYRVGETATAEDLTATTFERAWSRRGQYRGDADGFAGWLYTIARNVAHDYFRKSPSLVTLDAVDQTVAPESVAEQVEQARAFAALVAAIRRLSERERDLIALKYGAELTNREIARQLRLTESNVGTILSRAVQRLRRDLEVNDER
jgi:RNA polymerase sigma-70 factor, ECF subfamily